MADHPKADTPAPQSSTANIVVRVHDGIVQAALPASVHTASFSISTEKEHPSIFVPADSTALYTALLALVAVATIIASVVLSNRDRNERSNQQTAQVRRENDAAITTARAIFQVAQRRLTSTFETMAANRVPIGDEASLSAFAVRVLQPDVATAFADRFPQIVGGALALETFSHSLGEFRRRAFDAQSYVRERIGDETAFIKWVTKLLKRPPETQELHDNRDRWKTQFGNALYVEAMKSDKETIERDLTDVQRSIGSALQAIG